MNLIYIHGLDSDANSTKGILLESYCQKNHSDIKVYRPDLNQSPEQVFSYLTDLVTELKKDNKTVLIGSSLGGYFSTLVSNHTGCPALLLNPSTQPHITLQRFYNTSISNRDSSDGLPNNKVLHTTAGGWNITPSDLQWFADHQLLAVNYPDKVALLLKKGDELLNSELSKAFYRSQGASVTVQAGGDHRFSDFDKQLPMVIDILQDLGRV
ncbi:MULTISPECIES: YqiA/YcfP family alpha/beta fold hydrolase [unclassified Psychrobacter]|mgnify:CR=1 FL=1|uniref:YqiA/YcfP family alpha/beta fold hydrolase n=1 Tax=unclassified Psychrobacter TaxID=196806 RepID=UPI00191A31AF|nr:MULTISPECIES: YqiA/YcfP family alpha/beta fold hydrolase [unclassified Psychrobacter]